VTLTQAQIPVHSHSAFLTVARNITRDTTQVSGSYLGGVETCPSGGGLRRRLLQAAAAADPGFPVYGHLAIKPEPSPGMVGEVNEITMLVQNFGAAAAMDVVVKLSFNDWGVTFQGWQEIGTVTISEIGGSASVSEVLTHVFENRAHTCLQAEIISTGGDNADDGNDRTQINWEVVHAEEVLNMLIPFGNAAEEDVVVDGLEVLCVVEGEVKPCEGDFKGPHLEAEGAARLLKAGLSPMSEQGVELVVPEVLEEGLVVVVQARLNGELNHVMVEVVKSSVEGLLHAPLLCCIASVRTRVLLETILASALEAYEQGDCRVALKLLRSFVQKAVLLECDLGPAEKACLEKAIRVAVDVARMIVAEGGFAAKTFVTEGDFFRRAGLYEAAILEYAKGCPRQAPEPPASTPPVPAPKTTAAPTSSSSTTTAAPTSSSTTTSVAPTSSSTTTTAAPTTSSSTTAMPTTTPMPDAPECPADEMMYVRAKPGLSTAAMDAGTVEVAPSAGPSATLAHNNRQPYLGIQYVIALQGVFPSRS